jgi:mono/diheme cytochrome c family protein
MEVMPMPFLKNAIRTFFSTHIRPNLLTKVVIATSFVFVFIFLFAIVSNVQAEAPGAPQEALQLQNATDGKVIFDEKCAGCHTIGGGKMVGPDLKGVTELRDLQWIKDFILDPAGMIASDPDAQQLYKEYNNFPMPDMGLTADQVDKVVAYLSNPGDEATAPPPTGMSSTGDPAVGKLLFTGEKALSNGGPSCISCHSVSSLGLLGGGGLGPDLTQVYQRFGEAGLASALNTLPFPTMIGPFQNHPLTVEEQADFIAYFKEVDQSQAVVPVIAPGTLTRQAQLFFGIAIVFAGILFALLWFLWVPLKKRYQPRLPVRKAKSL